MLGHAARQYHAEMAEDGSSTPPNLRAAAGAAVCAALDRAIATGRLPEAPEARAATVEVSRPANPEHGDLASNVALRLARPLRMGPPAIAEAIAAALGELRAADPTLAVAAAAAAGPGFLNLHLADSAIEAVVDRARADPAAWGRAAPGKGAVARHVN